MDKRNESAVLEECVAYFKARPVYEKLFRKVRDKYGSLGHMGGTIVLAGLDREERNQLSGFFQKDYAENKSITISAGAMEKCLQDSRFSEITWEEILEAYFGEPLTVKKEERQKQSEKRKDFFGKLLSGYPEGEGKDWLESVLRERKEGYLLIMQLYRESPEKLSDVLGYVMKADTCLPEKSERKKPEFLAVFASKVTGNPHYFDDGRVGGKLLSAYLKERFGKSRPKEVSRAEYQYSVYYEAGILKDGVSNDVLAYGIHGYRADGTVHMGLEGFLENQEPVKLTLQTIGNLERIEGQAGMVYVVENPTEFSVLVSEFPKGTFLCGNGQLRLAVLALMDKFPEETVFWYAGDFDPEGLLIAQRLKERYQERLQLWNYCVPWYEKHLSEVRLDAGRVKKLERVRISELQEMKEAIGRERKAAYQEAMIEKLCLSLKRHSVGHE